VFTQVEYNINQKSNSLSGSLKKFPKVYLKQVCGTETEPLWNELVNTYHYLGFKQLLGKRLKYLAFIQQYPVAALSWSAPAKRINARDSFIGWSDGLRKKSLSSIVANSRFVIFPWVQIAHIGSHIMGMNLRCLKNDWFEKFQEQLLLAETFVDPSLFKGTVYKASNWKRLGSTKGYSKRGKGYIYHGNIKDVYVYILESRYRKILGVPSATKPQLPQKVEETSLSLQQSTWSPKLSETFDLEDIDIDLLAKKLTDYHHVFTDCFYRSEQESIGLTYLSGLMSSIPRKTAEKIALEMETPQSVRSTQRFLKTYKWDYDAMLLKHQELTAERLGTDHGMITVDASEFPKKGRNSVGVARQYCGNNGKKDNCQSGVFVGYVGEKGHGLIDCQLYMPKLWFDEEHKDLCQQNLVPKELNFKTKNQIASDLINKVHSNFPASWIGCDASFGSDISFLNSLPSSLTYFADIKSNSKIFLEQPEVGVPSYSGQGKPPTKLKVLSEHKPISISELEKSDNITWTIVNLGEGSKGPLLAHVACLRVYPSRDGLPQNEPVWLIIRKRTDNQTRYAFSNAPITTTIAELCYASCLRWSIERCFQEGKMHLGMDHYEHRSWPAWHRHMLYVMLAQQFLYSVKQAQKKTV
jgi:SRSO17 transposase